MFEDRSGRGEDKEERRGGKGERGIGEEKDKQKKVEAEEEEELNRWNGHCNAIQQYKKVATKSTYYHTEVPVGLALLKELCQDNCMCRSLSSSAEMKSHISKHRHSNASRDQRNFELGRSSGLLVADGSGDGRTRTSAGTWVFMTLRYA